MAAAAVLLITSACQASQKSTPGASSDGEVTWIHGTLTPKADTAAYLLMADEQHYFRQHGINIQIKHFVGNIQLIQALVSGAIDSGDTSPDAVYPAYARGAKVKIIGSTVPKATYAILTKSDITSIAGLEGKTIGVSAPGSTPDLVVRALLEAKGLNASKVHVVNAGSDLQRFQALVAGRVDAVSVSVEFVPRIKDNPKLHVLTYTQDVVPDYPRFFLVANEHSLQTKRSAAVGFLAAEMQGVCYAVEHADRSAQVTAKLLKTTPDDPGITYSRKVLSGAHAASPTSAIPTRQLNYLNNYLLKSGRIQKPIDASAIVDGSIRKEALPKAKLPASCQNDPNAK